MPSSDQVYVRLLNEGTEAWRPVPAIRLADGLYRLSGTRVDDEEWEFESGTLVRCVHDRFSDGSEGLKAIANADGQL
jgi:hypothetical protein